MRRQASCALVAAVVGSGLGGPAHALVCDGSSPMIGSVCMTAATFCPLSFAEANGQLLSIAQNDVLFSLIGTTYGGDGMTTFALPDLRGRSPRHAGQGPGLGNVVDGQVGGQESVTPTVTQMPAHTHAVTLQASAAPATTATPSSALPASAAQRRYVPQAPDATLAPSTAQAGVAGGNQPVSVINPYLGLKFCIALEGIYPSRP